MRSTECPSSFTLTINLYQVAYDIFTTRRAFGRVDLPLTKVFRWRSK